MTRLTKIGGKPVMDAKKSVLLTISTGDVKAGKKKAPNCCAAALACQRHFGAEQAQVYLSRVYVELGDVWLRFKTSKQMRGEIIQFDQGGTFDSGVYTLEKMSPSMRIGRRNISHGTHPNKGRLGVKSPQRGNRTKAQKVQGVRLSASQEMARHLLHGE